MFVDGGHVIDTDIMHKRLYIIGLLLLLLASCTGDREVRAVLERDGIVDTQDVLKIYEYISNH